MLRMRPDNAVAYVKRGFRYQYRYKRKHTAIIIFMISSTLLGKERAISSSRNNDIHYLGKHFVIPVSIAEEELLWTNAVLASHAKGVMMNLNGARAIKQREASLGAAPHFQRGERDRHAKLVIGTNAIGSNEYSLRPFDGRESFHKHVPII